MASPLPSISRTEASVLIKQVQGTSLFNRQLSSVCQVNGLKSTGVKADLQKRIIDRESTSFPSLLLFILCADGGTQRGGVFVFLPAQPWRLSACASSSLDCAAASPLWPLPLTELLRAYLPILIRASFTAVIQETIAANDVSRFHQIRHSIINAQAQRSSPSKGASSRTNPIQSQPSSLPGSSYLSHSMPSYSHTNGLSRDYHSSPSNGSRIGLSFASSSPTLTFTQSPFYHVEAGLTDVRTCDGEWLKSYFGVVQKT